MGKWDDFRMRRDKKFKEYLAAKHKSQNLTNVLHEIARHQIVRIIFDKFMQCKSYKRKVKVMRGASVLIMRALNIYYAKVYRMRTTVNPIN